MSELKIYGHEPVETIWGSPTPQREPLLRVTVTWSTRIVEGHRSGLEYRTPLIAEPRYEIEGSDFVLTNESYATLSQAFQNTGGRARSFPFKNPIDYYCTADPEVLAEDIYQQGFIVPTGDGKGRVVKQFHCHGVNAYKTITYPIADTLSVGGLTVDEETGIVDGVSGTEWVACDCEYRQKYRFDVSDLQLTQIKRALDEFDINVYQTVNFRLVEDSYSKLIDLVVEGDWGVDIAFDLLTLPHADLTYSDVISTRIEQSINQLELREEVTNLKQSIILESGNLNKLNTQIFLTAYNACKGRLNGISFGEELVRFDSDTLAVEQLGINAFAINGLPVKAIAPTDTSDGLWYLYSATFFEGFSPGERFSLQTLTEQRLKGPLGEVIISDASTGEPTGRTISIPTALGIVVLYAQSSAQPIYIVDYAPTVVIDPDQSD